MVGVTWFGVKEKSEEAASGELCDDAKFDAKCMQIT